MKTRPILAATVAAGAVAVAVPALSGAQATGREITVHEKLSAETVVHRSKSAKGEKLATGDRVLTRQSMKGADGKRLGTLYTDCVNVGPKRNVFKAELQCEITYKFHDGQVVGAGVLQFSNPTTSGAIVGGSGAYSGATGTIGAGKPAKSDDSVDVLHLAG
jgi:hypothetical protein